jgi:hypothetical protein
MPLQKIAPNDIVVNNNMNNNSCWRDATGRSIPYDPEDPFYTPSFGNYSFSNGNPNALTSNEVSVTNYYLDEPGNLQFSYISSVTDATGLGAIQNIVTGCKNTRIRWGGVDRTSFSVISIARGSYKSALLPGSFRLGSLTDDSNMDSPQILNCGRAYNIVTGITLPNNGFTYGRGARGGSVSGLFLPDVGLIIGNISVSTPFTLHSEDPNSSTQVFIRARNNEYNYSMNPSFISGSTGDLWFKSFDYYPQTYITSVGLYNDDGILMATAKLPKPFKKTFETELLMNVTLNF